MSSLSSSLSAAPMTKQAWIERELFKMPQRSREWRTETLRLWGLQSVSPENFNEIGIESRTTASLIDDNSADVTAQALPLHVGRI